MGLKNDATSIPQSSAKHKGSTYIGRGTIWMSWKRVLVCVPSAELFFEGNNVENNELYASPVTRNTCRYSRRIFFHEFDYQF